MPADLASILKLEVPVIVQIGRRALTVAEVMRLSHGSIIELPKRSDEELEVLVNNRVIGRGEVVKVGENFGIRVLRTGQIEERIDALGPAVHATPSPGAAPVHPSIATAESDSGADAAMDAGTDATDADRAPPASA